MHGVDPKTEADALRSLLKMQPLADMVESHFGERCEEYDPDCACCRAWRWIEVVRVVVGPESLVTGSTVSDSASGVQK